MRKLSLRRNITALLASTVCAISAMAATASTVLPDAQRTDFRDETIYFAMTTRFYDGDPTNNVCGWDHQDVQIANNDPDWRGDFAGLIDRLDYIKALGFTTVWITPVVQNCSGTDFHGYHAMDFSKVDLRYESRTNWGAEKDVRFQDLIDAAHAKGMKIVLDIVLNHTGNFGEAHFAELFYRSSKIKNQASVSASLTPNYDKLPTNYNDLSGTNQYNARFPYLKNTDGTNKDNHNYWHHIGTNWNWDYPNRWWGQIAGDCVDLNTENPAVAEYLVKCYGEFIKMGVDGFRIDTTGHISRLTFNVHFIPQFQALAEQYKDKRLNGCPFFMFGECCARFSEPTYRDQPNLSSYFYTWKSPEDLVAQWNHDATYWDNIFIKEGDDTTYGNMALCLEEPSVTRESDNVFMKDGSWHEPDYSDYSGFSIIDFPMHYNFNNAAAAVSIAQKGDKYYNDASYNVVYVDSHDYCPGPNDGTRFNGGTQQWAENLSLMFTFRGIPCIYYGSEVEFQKGKKVDAGGTNTPVKESGRAYFGHYLEGTINTTDFGVYTAEGNIATTLGGDLSQHIIRLNKIRAAVPALRKGQYTWDGCTATDGWAFKRAYKDSYALVAINGGATFSSLPAGKYTDLITGTEYTATEGGSITVEAPSNKGQLRVLVKDWTGGKVGEDGKFIYTTTAVDKGGNPSFTDNGTTQFYTADDAEENARVTLTPGGSSFRTSTVTITAQLNETAVSGWYQVGTATKVNMTPGNEYKFELGADMSFGQTVNVAWGATDSDGNEYTGSETYKKVDPDATITIYVKSASAPTMYAWYSSGDNPVGSWPGLKLSQTKEVAGDTYYYYTFNSDKAVNIIFSLNGSNQTDDITGIATTTFFEYDGNGGYKVLDVTETTEPGVIVSPKGGDFVDNVTVTLSANSYTTSATYSIDGGEATTLNGTATITLGNDMTVGQSTTISWTASDGTATKTGQVTFTKIKAPSCITVYYDDSETKWNSVNIYFWGLDGASTTWPGIKMTSVEDDLWSYTFPVSGTPTGIVFCKSDGSDQTGDICTGIVDGLTIRGLGDRKWVTGVNDITVDNAQAPVQYYNLQGIEVNEDNLTPGIYIRRQGNAVGKVLVK